MWLTVSQSVSLGVETHPGLMTTFLLLFDSYGLVFVGRSLWREDGSVFCICCWHLQRVFPGSESLGTRDHILLSQIWDFLLVASYDSHTHLSQSQSHIATDGRSVSQSVIQSVSKSLCRASSGAHNHIFITVWQLRSCFCGVPSLTTEWVSFVYAGGPCQLSFSRVRIPRDSRPYFTVSDLRLTFSSPPTARRVMVDVFDPASTRVPVTDSLYIAAVWTT
jgi:hypothetical protein